MIDKRKHNRRRADNDKLLTLYDKVLLTLFIIAGLFIWSVIVLSFWQWLF